MPARCRAFSGRDPTATAPQRRKAKPVVRPTDDGFQVPSNSRARKKKMRETKRKCFSRSRNSRVVSSANSPVFRETPSCCWSLCALISLSVKVLFLAKKGGQDEREEKEDVCRCHVQSHRLTAIRHDATPTDPLSTRLQVQTW